MKIYFYAKSGHTIGLEATKKCATIINILKNFDPVLCTSDFRAGAFAKDNLGVKKYVNIDVVRNLTNIMQRNDILFYSSDEVNEQMKEDMKDFCSLSYCIDDFEGVLVDKSLYTKNDNPSLEKTIFFGDDDYYNQFLEMATKSDKSDTNLLIGHYFFLGNEKVFKNHFVNVIDEEEYVDTIVNSKYLLTASLQTACESIACGNKPVLFKREDKKYDDKLISKLNIPVIGSDNLNELIFLFEQVIKNYPTLGKLDFVNLDNVVLEIKNKIELFNKLNNI
jgi:hypothetical protein